MKTADVIITDRVRKSAGFLDSLIRSIEELGVLQPIGVTPDNVLLFGYRRLMAAKRLGLEEIPARVIDINPDNPAHLLRIEQDENNQRVDFTPSEKVEIARRIEEALAGRNHRPEKVCKNLHTLDAPQGTSRDLAASKVGWSGETYRKAKAVIESGDEEVIEAMDKGEMSVHKAHQVVKKKPEPLPNPAPMTITVKLAYQLEPDARSIIKQAGGEYATKLALSILQINGHKVNIQ